jgi:predicted Co/Zn/Cd cation transporter (cation efflux family)
MIGHLTSVVPPRYAPDISGVTTTTMQIAGAIAVAAFGTLYLGLASGSRAVDATRAFAIVTAALAVISLIAAAGAQRSAREARARRRAR